MNRSHSITTKLMLVICVLFLSSLSAFAQDPAPQPPSTDRDNPTPLTSNVITSDGVDDKTEYFYSFAAGPGEIAITLDVKANKNAAVSSVDIALYDAKSRRLMSTYANPDHGSSKRSIETVKIRGTQTLLLEVTVSPGVDNFQLKLNGALKIQSTTTDAIPTATPTPTPQFLIQ